MRVLLVSALVVLVFTQTAVAVDIISGNVTGNDLKEWEAEYEAWQAGRPGALRYNAGVYSGYVLGVADAYNGTAWCSGAGVTRGQVMDVVTKYLRDTPERLDQPAHQLIRIALAKAFSCKK